MKKSKRRKAAHQIKSGDYIRIMGMLERVIKTIPNLEAGTIQIWAKRVDTTSLNKIYLIVIYNYYEILEIYE